MSGLLTIASGLIGVYVVLALITAHFAESIAALLQLRGTALYNGLRELLGEVGETKLVAKLYANPLIGGLGTSARKPSYIPTRTMTLSLIAVMRELAQTPAAPAAPGVPVSPLVDLSRTQADFVTDFKANLTALQPSSPAARGLSQVLQTARNDYASVLKAVDDWFGEQMDRVSGTYSRWSAVVQAVIAALLVGLLNVDTLAIVQQLTKNSALASALATMNPKPDADFTAQLQKFETLIDSGLQFGWTTQVDAAHLPSKIGGLFLTWAAVLLGAPFWFNVLKTIVPVRLTGAKPEDPNATGRDAQMRSS